MHLFNGIGRGIRDRDGERLDCLAEFTDGCSASAPGPLSDASVGTNSDGRSRPQTRSNSRTEAGSHSDAEAGTKTEIIRSLKGKRVASQTALVSGMALAAGIAGTSEKKHR